MYDICTRGLISRLCRLKDFNRKVREGNAKIAEKNFSRHNVQVSMSLGGIFSPGIS
jgi:hypothetical protein